MVTEIVVPTDLKSDIKLSVGRWFKHVGDPVSRNEPLVEIDTDNLTREICASTKRELDDKPLGIGCAGAEHQVHCQERSVIFR